MEAEVRAFDVDIARQTAEPGGELVGKGKDQADGDQGRDHEKRQDVAEDQAVAQGLHNQTRRGDAGISPTMNPPTIAAPIYTPRRARS